jgi:hypothetical protein
LAVVHIEIGRNIVDGPFAEPKELVGGFYIIEVGSLEEAISWALRAPSGPGAMPDGLMGDIRLSSSVPVRSRAVIHRMFAGSQPKHPVRQYPPCF